MSQETALITGASSGIGLELARRFAADGARLVLVARREDRLQALAQELRAQHGTQALVVPADLSQPDACAQVLSAVTAAATPVDVLVNSAGFAALGQVVDLPLQRQLEMVRVNVTALTHLTRALVGGMVQRRRGGILNIASTAAFQPGPNMAVYYATKAYVLSFTEALHEELVDTGVTVSCLCPGPTATELVAGAGLQHTLLFHRGVMSAADVARLGYRGFRRGRAVVVTGYRNRLGTLLVRLAPRSVTRQVVKRLQMVKRGR